MLAGLAAQGETKVLGISHWRRGYDKFENKLNSLGGNVKVFSPQKFTDNSETSLVINV